MFYLTPIGILVPPIGKMCAAQAYLAGIDNANRGIDIHSIES